MAGGAPGGLSPEYWEGLWRDTGTWVWGTAQGAFNEKATMSQIIADAVIGMIPVVGDVTAARDLIAITIGLCEDPRKREDKWQWIMLVILICALLPVIGGVIKGVGRLLLKAIGESAHLIGAARAAHLLEAAKEIIAFLNHAGLGNAEKFFLELKFATYEHDLVKQFTALLDVIEFSLRQGLKKVRRFVPDSMVQRAESLAESLKELKKLAVDKIPEGIKQLDADLRELQAYIRAGGETTSQATAHAAEAAAKEVHRAEELVLLEGKAAMRSKRGGLVANSSDARDVSKYYTPEPNYPDLTSFKPPQPDGVARYPNVATYAGKIVNRELGPGERVFRVFGPGNATHGVNVNTSFAAGGNPKFPSFWGLNEVPEGAEAWRHRSAVLDEWNRNGFMVVGTVLDGHSLPACTGLIAEQTGKKIGAQYLTGGAKQAMLQLPEEIGAKLNEAGARVMATGTAETVTLGGMRWEFRPTKWPDVNGIHGYRVIPGPAAVQTARIGAKVVASKRED